jgi:hypothetical protein
MWIGPGPVEAQNPEWNLLEEINGVKISIYESDCDRALDTVSDPTVLSDENALAEASKKTILLRFENTNTFQVDISWNNILRSDQNSPDSFLSLNGLGTSNTECIDSPVIQLTNEPNDGYPVSATEALSFLNIKISSN